MDVKERVRVNVYKQLLEEEKKKSKMFKTTIISTLLVFMLSIPVLTTFNSNNENLEMLAYIYEEENGSILDNYNNLTESFYTYNETINETESNNADEGIFNISSLEETIDYGQADLYNDLFGL